MQSSRRAFTLIELLVVIAIIAILAAILFPVFAQAKEAAKKTAALSDAKQAGTAMIIYSTDGDDQFPSGCSVNLDGTVRWNLWTGYPAGWDAAQYEPIDGIGWANAMMPYMKNYDLLRVYSGRDTQIPDYFGAAAYSSPRKKPQKGLSTMNGLLSLWSASAVASPSKLPMLWYGAGIENTVGAVSVNPVLYCDSTKNEVCRFNSGGKPQAGSSCTTTCDVMFAPVQDANDTVWIVSKGMNFVATDSSAKYRKLNGSGTSNTSVPVRSYDDPYGSYGYMGQPYRWNSSNRCVSGAGSPRYWSFFRPDTEYNYQFGNSTTTMCSQ